jgi:GTP-binding protein Era
MTIKTADSSERFAGIIAIVGRPNVGKSTLLNALLGQKISITSRKPQTTRHRILGILTEENRQAILVDTPGLHSDEKRAINRLMNRAATSSISEVELVVFLVEGTHWTDDDQLVLNKIKKSGSPCVLVVNKVDNVQDKDELLPHLQTLGAMHNFSDIVPISASKGQGVDTISQLCLSSLPEGDFWFPEDQVTDRSSRFMASEVIREKLIRFTGDELPYSITVEIEQFKMDNKGIIHINALVLVERESQ